MEGVLALLDSLARLGCVVRAERLARLSELRLLDLAGRLDFVWDSTLATIVLADELRIQLFFLAMRMGELRFLRFMETLAGDLPEGPILALSILEV